MESRRRKGRDDGRDGDGMCRQLNVKKKKKEELR